MPRSRRTIAPYFALAAMAAIAPAPGMAQSFDQQQTYSEPYGMAPGQQNQPMEGSTRDANGNRVIVNGQFAGANYSQTQGGYKAGVGFGGPSATAIGNSLNVVTNGSWNTVIVTAEQENNGDQNAEVVLNGKVQF